MAYLGVTLLLAMSGSPGAAAADDPGSDRAMVKYFAAMLLALFCGLAF